MATLVFSTVGTVLGGPIGGAIGALIGQSIDQELLGPSSRGPRLGDLSVQSSSYGTQVPRIYGSMRVSGSVIWATDLVESSETTGAKGQPDTTFSYSVSFAVALSSRTAASIGRIWADGKLLRGVDGDFKVGTTFRFYGGNEDQVVDPLIASVEGIASTPAYRGLALVVFENLELAEYGNRIPFLTFEVIADEAPLTVGAILADASAGAVDTSADQPLVGYAAYGASMKAALEPIIDCFGIDLFDDGVRLRSSAGSETVAIAPDDLGNAADDRSVPRIERQQAPANDVATTLRLAYYDPARDYQSGEARASIGEQGGVEERREIPAVLDADSAKSLVQLVLARAWVKRDKVTLRLPPASFALEPGQVLDIPLSPSQWVVETCTIDSFVVIAELRPCETSGAALVADSGRIVASPDVAVGEAVLALFDTPASLSLPNAPSVTLAASTATPGWRSPTVELSVGTQSQVHRTAARKSKLGRALTALPSSDNPDASVDVEMVDPGQWLLSSDEEALTWGANTAILGREVIQFAAAMPIGAGQFRLSGLLRGRDGTESASAEHSADEWFVMVESNALRVIELPSFAIGTQIVARTIGPGSESVEAQATIGWGGLRPLTGSALLLDGLQVVGTRAAAIASPAGGSTVDSEARSAIDQLLGALRQHGLIEI